MSSMMGGESDSLRRLVSRDFFETIFTSSVTKEFPKTSSSFSGSCELIMLSPFYCASLYLDYESSRDLVHTLIHNSFFITYFLIFLNDYGYRGTVKEYISETLTFSTLNLWTRPRHFIKDLFAIIFFINLSTIRIGSTRWSA